MHATPAGPQLDPLEPLEPRVLFSATPATPAAPLLFDSAPPVEAAVTFNLPGDAYEDNNTRQTAFNLSGATGRLSDVAGLATNSDSADWYRIVSGPGRIFARLTNQSNAGDSLYFTLYNSNGVYCDGDFTRGDDATVSFTTARAGSYYLRVQTATGEPAGNTYDMTWNLPAFDDTPGILPHDDYGPINTRATAFDLPGDGGDLAQLNGVATSTDGDWFRLAAPAGGVTFTLDHNPGVSELGFEIYDAGGGWLEGSYSRDAVQTLSTDVAAAYGQTTDVYVFVFTIDGNYVGNGYNLTWDTSLDLQFPAPDPQGEDTYGAHGTRATAVGLPGGSGSLQQLGGIAYQTDGDDYYRLAADAGTVSFTITHDVVPGYEPLSLEIRSAGYDPIGVPRGFRTIGDYVYPTVDGTGTVTIELERADTVYVRVGTAYGSGANGSNLIREALAYDLTWSANPADLYEGSTFVGGANATDNDSRTTATELFGTSGNLYDFKGYANGEGDDWYRILPGVGELTASIDFEHDYGDLDLYLYRTTEPGYLVRDWTRGDGASISYDIVDNEPYFLRVRNYSVDTNSGPAYRMGDAYGGNPYNLTWSFQPRGTEDSYQPNSAFNEAYDVGAATNQPRSLSDIAGLGTSTDGDYYRIAAAAGELTVSLDNTHLDPNQAIATPDDLDFEIYGADGRRLGGSYGEDALSDITLDLDAAEDVTVFVYTASNLYTGTPYDLTWVQTPPAPPLIAGDVNGDGRVNLADFATLGTNFGSTSTGLLRADGDLNNDGLVNLADFALMGANFGT